MQAQRSSVSVTSSATATTIDLALPELYMVWPNTDDTTTPEYNKNWVRIAWTNTAGASSLGFGTNAINISDWHVMTSAGSGTDTLQMTVGHTSVTVSQENLGMASQNLHFFEGFHLFDLNRFRAVADWLSATSPVINITPDDGVQAGCYGTIYLSPFFDCLYNHSRLKPGHPSRSAQRPDCRRAQRALLLQTISAMRPIRIGPSMSTAVA